MKKYKLLVIASSFTAVLLLGALMLIAAMQTGGGTAAASQAQTVNQAQTISNQGQTTNPGTTNPNTTNPGTTTKPMTDTNSYYYNLYLQNLSTNLGVSKDKLTQSMVQAEKDTIAQAVKDGKLTQAQADGLNQRIDAMAKNGQYGFGGLGGPGFGFGPRGGMGMRGGPGMGALGGVMQQVVTAVANKLGITTSVLMTDLKTQTLAQIAQSKNVSVADLKTVIINTVKPTLDAAVKAGKLTQAQEDSIIQGIQNADFTQRGFGFGFGPGGFGGFGHRGFGPGGPGFGGPGNDNDNNNGSPNTTTPGSGSNG